MHPSALKRAFLDHLKFSRRHELSSATPLDEYFALALCIRDRLVDRWTASERCYREQAAKRIYYLSAEFLTGRALISNLQALDIEADFRDVLQRLDIDLDTLIAEEPEPGLGNGGLGRLAACFMESMATIGLPAMGYGIRYEFGIFEQVIRHGQQIERADEWLRFGNPWEMARPEHTVTVNFGGSTQHVPETDGYSVHWTPQMSVIGVPHDIPIAGFRNNCVNPLRLWRARSGREFDFQLFNAGDYVNAVERKNASEVISKVLYPNDNFDAGRELRLQQEYFFVSCSIQDILRQHLSQYPTLSNLSDKVAIQLNDTHPAVAVAELMRLLIDEHGMSWERAWDQTVATLGFTNHTLLPEALERWPVNLFARLLPRHLEIIREIDRRFVREVMTAYPHDRARAERMSIIDRAEPPHIHMARLAVVGSHAVNGVAALHSHLLRTRVMRDFHELYPGRFSNKTNGVTPRRWLLACNPQLAATISQRIGDDWISDLDQLLQLEEHLDDTFLDELAAIKLHHKQALAKLIHQLIGVRVDPQAIYDVQVKRLHEYKRQLLNALHIVALYLRAKRGEEVVPRVFIFGAKAAPGYRQAKLIIRLLHALADVINHDPRVPHIRVAFLPNYRVTLAERIIPAADVSEQISTAGKEASGTGNMKLSMNGALTIGTYDGANIEIREAVGEDNFFLFGMNVDEVAQRLQHQPGGRIDYQNNEELQEVVDLIRDGFFSPDEPDLFRSLMDSILAHDEYMVLGDFVAYAGCQQRLADTYVDKPRWGRMAAINIARVGHFSSDRTIREYASEIWGVAPLDVPVP